MRDDYNYNLPPLVGGIEGGEVEIPGARKLPAGLVLCYTWYIKDLNTCVDHE